MLCWRERTMQPEPFPFPWRFHTEVLVASDSQNSMYLAICADAIGAAVRPAIRLGRIKASSLW